MRSTICGTNGSGGSYLITAWSLIKHSTGQQRRGRWTGAASPPRPPQSASGTVVLASLSCEEESQSGLSSLVPGTAEIARRPNTLNTEPPTGNAVQCIADIAKKDDLKSAFSKRGSFTGGQITAVM